MPRVIRVAEAMTTVEEILSKIKKTGAVAVTIRPKASKSDIYYILDNDRYKGRFADFFGSSTKKFTVAGNKVISASNEGPEDFEVLSNVLRLFIFKKGTIKSIRSATDPGKTPVPQL